MLSDCGADVIKVEATGGGDVMRGPTGNSRVFAHFNAGKRSIALDLTQTTAQEIAHELIAQSDVLIENFRPGVMAKFGLGYNDLKARFPRLVYCSISGFGQQGPFAQRAAYAPIAHAASGFDYAYLSSQGNVGGRPPDSGIMIADMLTGSYAFGAIQTALLGRAQSDQGDYVDVTMMESMMSLIPRQLQAAQLTKPPPDGGFRPIQVRDGYVMICIISEKNMRSVARAMGREDLLDDPRFAQRLQRYKNMNAFVAEIESWSEQLSAQECEAIMNKAGVPCSVYTSTQELFEHPQIAERGAFKQLHDPAGPFKIQNPPFQFVRSDISTADSVPELGEHTTEVLEQLLGYDATTIKQLCDSGAAYQYAPPTLG
jgi:crotonobetainyl-CoA:carnitine CoA-transferase CaiB-like acyl-CoA transferase